MFLLEQITNMSVRECVWVCACCICITQYAHVYPLFLGRLCVVAFRIEFAWKHLRNNLATATAAAAATPPPTHTPALGRFATCAVFVGTNVAKSLTDTEIQWQLQIHLQHIITEPAPLLRVFTMKINIFVPRRVRSKYPHTPPPLPASRSPYLLSVPSINCTWHAVAYLTRKRSHPTDTTAIFSCYTGCHRG